MRLPLCGIFAAIVSFTAIAASSFGSPLPAASPHEIIFIDSAVSDPATLVAAVKPGVETVQLDPSRDELAQIGAVLRTKHGLSAIHILSHGAPGALQLGSQRIDTAALGQIDFSAWRAAMAPDAKLSLYGCNVARGSAGRVFVKALAAATGAEIQASDDVTGSSKNGGNWILEQSSGGMFPSPVFDTATLSGYQYTLALPNNEQTFTAPTYWNSNTGGNTVDGFSLAESTGATLGTLYRPDFYFDSCPATDTDGYAYYEITWTADGVDLGSFDLSQFSITNFGGGDATFRLDFTGRNGQTQSYTSTGIGSSIRQTINLDSDKFSGLTSFKLRVTITGVGGHDASNLGLEGMTLAHLYGPDAAPSVANLNGDSVTFTEKGSAVLLDASNNATATDSDSTDFSGGNLTAAIITNRVSAEDVLSIVNQGTDAGQIGISGSDVTYAGTTIGTVSGGTGTNNLVVAFNTNATPSAAQALIRALTYRNSNTTAPSSSTRTVRVTINDGDGGTSANADVSVTIALVNDAPVVTSSGGSAAFTAGDNTQGTPVVVDAGLTVSDADNTTLASATVSITGNFHSGEDVLTFSNTNAAVFGNIVGSYNAGAGVLTLTSSGATATLAQWQAALRAVAYTDSAVTPNTATRTISFVANDGTANSTAATRTVTVSTVDQTPIITISGGSTTFTEAGGAVVINNSLTLSDNDNTTLASASVSITGNFRSGEDVLTFTNDGSTMGNIVASYNSGTGRMNLTSSGATATLAQWQAALRSITFNNTSSTPNTANRTISFAINDGTKTSSANTQTVTVTAVNNPPVNTVPAAQSLPQDATLTFGTGKLISISDADAGAASVKVTLTATHGTLTLSGITGLSFAVGSGTGDTTMTFIGTIADINAALNGLTYSPTSGYYGSASLQITTDDQGNSGSGGAATDTDSISITVTPPHPTVTNVSSSTADGSYRAGSAIAVTVTFDQPVNVDTTGGTPTLTLETGLLDRSAAYVSGSGSTTLVFSYTVQSGDTSSDLDYASTSALALNGATIRNASSVDAALTLPAVGGASSLAGQKALVIDTTAPAIPTVLGLSSTVISGTAEASSTVTVLVDGSSVGTTTADGSGHWSHTLGSALAAGSHSFAASTTDSAGNSSATSTANTVTVGSGTIRLVTTNADSGVGSLRQAMTDASAGDTILFNLPGGSEKITLASPLPPIIADLTIDGGTLGNVVIDGASAYRIFFVDTGTVALKNLVLQNALAQGGAGGNGDGGGGGGAGLGAGLFVNQASAVVTVTNVNFYTMRAVGGTGGNYQSSTPPGGGGGGMGYRGGNATGNSGGPGGGGMLAPGADVSGGGNGGAGGAGGGGGGGYHTAGIAGIGGSAYAGNTAGSAGGTENGGAGGFGGGGGGAAAGTGGAGGFGGGGGGTGVGTSGGVGGPGGGGGGSGGSLPPTSGGSLGSGISGGASGGLGGPGGGGGGAAAGPAIFVRLGSLTTINSGYYASTAAGGAGGTGYVSASAGSAGSGDSTNTFNFGGTVNGSVSTGPIPSALVDLAPSLTVVHLSSNGASASYAKTGDTVILTFTASRSVASPSVVLAGHSVTAVNSSGNTWSASVVVSDADTEGLVAFMIAFTGTDGLAGTPATHTTDSSSVTFDRTAPAAPVISTASGNITETAPTLTGTAEPNSIVAIYDGLTFLGTTTADGTGAWSYTLASALADGTHAFTAKASDPAGNTGTGASLSLIKGTVPTIVAKPTDQSVPLGVEAIFRVTASGTATLAYQWQRSSDGTTFADISGANSATYTIASANLSDAGYYRVVVTNGFGSVTSVSAAFALSTNFPAPTPDGFASAATGGGNSDSVLVFTAADFITQATSASPCNITVVGQLPIGTVNVASNKTIQGANASAALVGNLNLSGVSNVIIRGLNLTHPGTTIVSGAYTDGGDALTIAGSSKVFVNHCTFFDCADHDIKIVGGSDNVTISWCEFYASDPTLLHRYSVQIGAANESRVQHVTLHHNAWTTHLDQHMPFSTGGYVHQYNNYVDAADNTAGAIASDGSQFLSERNVFSCVANPLTKQNATSSLPAGKICALGNSYTSCSGTAGDTGADAVFTPAYSYEMLPVSDVASEISSGAGNIAGANSVDAPIGTASISGPGSTVMQFTSFTLTASATGFTPSSYQWRFNNAAITGATSATLTLESTQVTATAAGTYTVAITLASGDTVVSAPYTLTVDTTTRNGSIKGGGGAPSWFYIGLLALLGGWRRFRKHHR